MFANVAFLLALIFTPIPPEPSGGKPIIRIDGQHAPVAQPAVIHSGKPIIRDCCV